MTMQIYLINFMASKVIRSKNSSLKFSPYVKKTEISHVATDFMQYISKVVQILIKWTEMFQKTLHRQK